MTQMSSLDASVLAARRRRLSIDYDFCTRDAKLARREGESPLHRATRLGFSKLRRQFLPHYFESPPRWRVLLRNISSQRSLPDFGVIGPMKSGTTDLAATLMAHPNVLCPLVKEFESADPVQWRQFYPTRRAVQRHGRRHGICLMPFVGPYLHCIAIASNLSRLKPRTKIIINLRNPSELVFSEWKWIVLHTSKEFLERTPFLATFTNFVDKAVEAFPGTPGPIGTSLHSGIYWHSVAHWVQSFGDENVRTFDISDYFVDRTAYMEQVSQFVGLPHVAFPAELPIANRNPMTFSPPTKETMAKLREFFDPYNRRLWSVLGTTHPW